jgi:thioredoxin 1
LAEKDFQAEVLRASSPVLVDFYAHWCGPCRKLAPVLEKLAGQFGGQIRFFKVNVDEAPSLAQRHGVSAVPALLLFKEGRVVDSLTGFVSVDELKNRLQRLIQIKATGAGAPEARM